MWTLSEGFYLFVRSNDRPQQRSLTATIIFSNDRRSNNRPQRLPSTATIARRNDHPQQRSSTATIVRTNKRPHQRSPAETIVHCLDRPQKRCLYHDNGPQEDPKYISFLWYIFLVEGIIGMCTAGRDGGKPETVSASYSSGALTVNLSV